MSSVCAHAPRRERGQRLTQRAKRVAAPARQIAGHGAGAGVEVDAGDQTVELGTVVTRVGPRAVQALFVPFHSAKRGVRRGPVPAARSALATSITSRSWRRYRARRAQLPRIEVRVGVAPLRNPDGSPGSRHREACLCPANSGPLAERESHSTTSVRRAPPTAFPPEGLGGLSARLAAVPDDGRLHTARSRLPGKLLRCTSRRSMSPP
jgi:hypothetical protein